MGLIKNVAFENRMVMGLLCVFGVALAGALLKHLGVFSAAAPVRAPGTLPEAMQKHWSAVDPSAASPAPEAPASSTAGAAYTAQTLRDPFQSWLPEAPQRTVAENATVLAQRTEPATPPSPPRLTVQGVLWGGSEPHAIVNDEVYRAGDTIEGARIVAIDRRGITIELQGSLVSYPVASTPTGARSDFPRAHRR